MIYIYFIFLIFLPFGQALTINLGFPLKLSEIGLIGLTLIMVVNKVQIEKSNRKVFIYLVCFSSTLLMSFYINSVWSYSYQLTQYKSRFGYNIDSLMKFLYVLFSLICFIVACQVLATRKKMSINFILTGAILSASYSLYLFACGILDIDPYLLWGMDKIPQSLTLFGHKFYRCGTFKEGNYSGLFLILSSILAYNQGHKKSSYFLFFSTISTLSTITYICDFILVFFYSVSVLKNQKNIIVSLVLVSILAITIISSWDILSIVIYKKLKKNNDVAENIHANYSRDDRTNSILAGISLFLDNPIIGVGLGNYSRHYSKYYISNKYKFHLGSDYKYIVNNVFVEILCEGGILSFVFFALFYFQIILIAYRNSQYEFIIGLLIALLYQLAFPTFTMMYLWVFYACSVTIKKDILIESSNSFVARNN